MPLRTISRDAYIYLLIAAMTLVVGVLAHLVRDLPGGPGAHDLPLWLLVAMFALGDRLTVHLHFRDESHAFSLSELALVIGLFFGAPAEVMLAQVLGGVLSGLVRRGQSLLKQTFNAAASGVEAGVAILLVYQLCGQVRPGQGWSWLAVIVGLLAGSAVTSVLVSGVIALSGAARFWGDLYPGTLLPSLLFTLTNGSVAVAGAAVASVDPAAAITLVVPAAMLYRGYLSLLRERHERERVAFLLSCSRALSGAVDDRAAIFLGLLRQRFEAGVVELVLFDPEDPLRASRTTVDARSAAVVDELSEPQVATLVRIAGQWTGSAVGVGSDPAFAPMVSRVGLGAGSLVAPLRRDRRAVGALIVGPPLSAAAHHHADSRLLLEALAEPVAAAFENDQLNRALTQLLVLQGRLQHQATHDTLTALPNRRLFLERLQEALLDPDADPAVLFLDLDGFKRVNDTLGHAAGDRLLQHVAERLTSSPAADHLAARIGGDEFAVLLPRSADGRAEQVSQSLLAAIHEPVDLLGTTVQIGVSIGVARRLHDDDRAADLLRHADIAMYVAKSEGKGSVVGYEPAHEHAAAAARSLPLQATDRRSAVPADLPPFLPAPS